MQRERRGFESSITDSALKEGAVSMCREYRDNRPAMNVRSCSILSLEACPTLPKLTDLRGMKIILTESKSLILSQLCASKFSCFLMSDRFLVKDCSQQCPSQQQT